MSQPSAIRLGQALLPADAAYRVEDEAAEISFRVPDDFAYCQGHFPGCPLVPGVTQIGWALAACRLVAAGSLGSVSKFRFVRPIRSGETIRVEARGGIKGFDCRVYANEELASRGRVGWRKEARS